MHGAAAGPGLQSASFTLCPRQSVGVRVDSVKGLGAQGFMGVLGCAKATVGWRYPAFLIIVFMVSRSH